MIRSMLFASVIALSASAAQAQAPDLGGRDDVIGGNIVGGVVATISGSGDNMVIQYSDRGAGPGGAIAMQVPRLARGRNDTDGLAVEYLQPEPAPAGREAWVTGGGDNAQLVYRNPHR